MGKNKGKRRGARPSVVKQSALAPELTAGKAKISAREHVAISFRFLQKGWGFDELSEEKLRSFITKWERRSQFTWKELATHPRHGLGKEKIPQRAIKPAIPLPFTDVSQFDVYRHHGNLPVVGCKIENVYYPIWIEAHYGDLYNHSGN